MPTADTMNHDLFERYKRACDFEQLVTEKMVMARLKTQFGDHFSIQRFDSLQSARAARAAGDVSFCAIGCVMDDKTARFFLELLESGCWLIFDIDRHRLGWVPLPHLT